MKCPAIFKGSGTHHSMAYRPSGGLPDLTFVSRLLYYFSPFARAIGNVNCSSEWSDKSVVK